MKEAEANRLKALQLSGLGLQRNLSFVWRKGKHFSRATHAFIDFFLTYLNTNKGASPKPTRANLTALKEE
jgi:DNA-binding transcriptional LysR family regulator